MLHVEKSCVMLSAGVCRAVSYETNVLIMDECLIQWVGCVLVLGVQHS